MPNYDLPKKDTSQTQPVPSITQEQITQSMSDILFQRMNQSEVELMKAENAELKETLGNFGKNYNKFEDLTNNLIRQNSGELLKLLNELHNRQEQKLNALRTSNDELGKNISAAVKTMKDEIRNEVSLIYEKIQKDTSQSLKKYTDSIADLEKKSIKFWAFEGIKEALFWCMCLAVILLTGKPALDVYGIEVPAVVWQFAYPCSLIPLVGYAIRVIAEKANNK